MPLFIGWHVPYITDDARTALLESYKDRLKNLDSLEPLEFPVLSDFDDQMKRIK